MLSQESTIETPPQPRGERRRLWAFWTVVGLLSLGVALGNAPYDIRQQSTIMVKSETVRNIWSTRETFKHWPSNPVDPKFGYGDLAKAESTTPDFRLESVSFDKDDPQKEIAVYRFIMRGQQGKVKVNFDPKDLKRRERD